MKKKEWMRMIRAGEGLTVEFKQQIPKLDRLARSFSAFANSAGGCIFFGVADSGELTGLVHVEGTLELIEQVAGFHCSPPLKYRVHHWEPVRGLKLLVLEIPEAEEKPVYAVSPQKPKDAWPYFRSDKENLPLDRKSLKTMRKTVSLPLQEDIDKLDRHAVRLLNQLNLTPRITLQKLGKAANISPHRAKKIIVELERNGWIHAYFNEKRREYSLAVPWRKR